MKQDTKEQVVTVAGLELIQKISTVIQLSSLDSEEEYSTITAALGAAAKVLDSAYAAASARSKP